MLGAYVDCHLQYPLLSRHGDDSYEVVGQRPFLQIVVVCDTDVHLHFCGSFDVGVVPVAQHNTRRRSPTWSSGECLVYHRNSERRLLLSLQLGDGATLGLDESILLHHVPSR